MHPKTSTRQQRVLAAASFGLLSLLSAQAHAAQRVPIEAAATDHGGTTVRVEIKTVIGCARAVISTKEVTLVLGLGSPSRVDCAGTQD